MYWLPISILFTMFAIFSFKIAFEHHAGRQPGKTIINDISMGLIFQWCAILFPFMYLNRETSQAWQDFFFLISDLVIFSFIGFLMVFIISEHVKARKDPARKTRRGYEAFLEKRNKMFRDDPAMKIRMDTNRKFLHLIPVGVIWLAAIIALLVRPILPTGLTSEGFGLFLIVLVGYAFCTMFMIAEILRLLQGSRFFHLDPEWAHRWFLSSLKDSEQHSFISSIPIVLCLMPFVFAPAMIFITVANVASLSDAAASLFGKRYGNKKLRLNKDKTWIGLIAGGLVSFFSVFITGIIVPIEGIGRNLPVILVMSAGASGVFICIDVFARHIGDNFLNPLLCGAYLILVYAFIA